MQAQCEAIEATRLMGGPGLGKLRRRAYCGLPASVTYEWMPVAEFTARLCKGYADLPPERELGCCQVPRGQVPSLRTAMGRQVGGQRAIAIYIAPRIQPWQSQLIAS